jgi:hypothetical protein
MHTHIHTAFFGIKQKITITQEAMVVCLLGVEVSRVWVYKTKIEIKYKQIW